MRSAGHRSWQIRQPAAQSKLRELRQRARSACFVPVMQKMQNNRNFTLSPNVGPDLTMLYLQYAVALFIILLVPSLNLCGLSNSRMQQRITELGVRKAFGGTKSVLVRQILNENLMLTLLGGVVGLLFSYLAVYAMRMWLFTNNQNVGTSGEFSLNMEALFSPWVFLLAFVFCVVINLLSAALPAWIAARHTIVDSLNDK